MKKYFISTLFALAFMMMMAAGSTAEEHFTAGVIIAAVALAMLFAVAVLCKVWAKDLKEEVEDDEE